MTSRAVPTVTLSVVAAYNSRMKRAFAAVVLTAVAAATAGCAASRPATLGAVQLTGAKPVISRAKAVREVASLLHARPNWVRLVRVRDGELAWLGFSPRPTSAAAYVDAHGDRFSSVSDIHVAGTHPSPLAVIHALRRVHKSVWLQVLGRRVPFPHGNPTIVHPTRTRAEELRRLAGGLGGKLQRLQLVWADEKTTDVGLEWVAHFAHAHLRPISVPAGFTGHIRTYVGPAVEWESATGTPYGGMATTRPPRQRGLLPRRSYGIPVSLVQKLWQHDLDVWLAPIDARPAIIRQGALAALNADDARSVRLVFLRRDGKQEGLAWLIGRGNGRYALVSATSGRVLVSEVQT
ncbi:MAG: hypothetical protein QOG85_1237 [Gaiellaceae bacterium]|jgi:hypothetical protein|nr:hypothetical protein [Gaiellaceae bacterium]